MKKGDAAGRCEDVLIWPTWGSESAEGPLPGIEVGPRVTGRVVY